MRLVSFDLVSWNRPVPISARHAGELLSRAQHDPDILEPGSALQDFRAALIAEYPPLEADETDSVASPWAMTPTESNQLVELHLSWQAEDAVLLRIVELAIRHGVVLYDPQGPDVHSPRGIPRNSRGRTEAARTGDAPSPRPRPFVIGIVVLAVLLPLVLWLFMAAASRPVL
jgi:hypothetical protein